MCKDKFSISTLFEVELFATEKRKHHYLEKVYKVKEEHDERSYEIYYPIWLVYRYICVSIL